MLDWIAGALELTGAWAVGDRRRYSFLLFAACDIVWITYCLTQRTAYGILLVVVPMFFINIRNYIKWGKDE